MSGERELSNKEIGAFIDDGFVRIDDAFSRETADEARAILWRETGCDPDNTATWKKAVIRLAGYSDPPFARAANTPVLHRAFDQLVGKGRWQPRYGLGTFPIRFPSWLNPGDTGWHVDTSFGEHSAETAALDYMSWRVNVLSRGRALLMLFLFSDVGEDDAPTRIRVGSHLIMARRLAPAGEKGMSLKELAKEGFGDSAACPVALASGAAGTVYLCHPFLVHAAQRHRGKRPKFMAQPPLDPAEPFQLKRDDGTYSPVEQAIRKALALD
jgi:hypothetical protein